MISLNETEVHCLNSVCDDYENVHHIQESVVEAMGKGVSVAEMYSVLKHMADLKLLDVFVFDKKTQGFQKLSQWHELEKLDAWFLINVFGRKALDENWKAEDHR